MQPLSDLTTPSAFVRLQFRRFYCHFFRLIAVTSKIHIFPFVLLPPMAFYIIDYLAF